jgi:predicted TIM-barrel fold metal-dependent hydrolase
MSINVDYPDFPSIADQHAAVIALAKAEPARLHWATTFSMDGFGTPGWSERVNAGLATAKGEGARAVKIWKNVGMIEKDAEGRLIMLDHPGLSPVAEQVRALDLVLIGHQGEPHNCWLPLEQMTTDNDREYFRNHPQYHMFLHPDQPSYDDQIATRDRFVAAHPGLRFVGAHMGSLEYDVDRLGAFLDRFPDATVDLAARMSQVQYQSLRDRAKVRDFFIRYQDRLLYGTDLTVNPDADPAEFRQSAHAVWTADWRYLATDGTQRVDTLKADVRGLALPREVIDKVYYRNAVRVFRTARLD